MTTEQITERIWLRALRHSAQISLRETSDTLGTLYEIAPVIGNVVIICL
jgi:hypothetical protein